MCERREKMNNFFLGFVFVSYYSFMPKFLAFKTSDVREFLVFVV